MPVSRPSLLLHALTLLGALVVMAGCRELGLPMAPEPIPVIGERVRIPTPSDPPAIGLGPVS